MLNSKSPIQSTEASLRLLLCLGSCFVICLGSLVPAAANQPADGKADLPEGVLPPMNPESVPFLKAPAPEQLVVNPDDRIVIIGAGMASRMNHFGHFETELFLRNPDKKITIRNMADEGNTPGFRPHPGRNQDGQYAFPGAKELLPAELQAPSNPQGHFETPDQWLTRLGADTILAFFGFNSSFGGLDDVSRFEREFEAFLQHTLSQKYNGESIPQLAVISPTAYQDISDQFSVPDGSAENENLALYTATMAKVCEDNGVLFFDAFAATKETFEGSDTTDGCLLSDSGYRKLAPILANGLFGPADEVSADRETIHG
ncbi:MAG: SGNH/GDSL hydrolase family protein, partial [Verrucomicrobiota bacterium]